MKNETNEKQNEEQKLKNNKKSNKMKNEMWKKEKQSKNKSWSETEPGSSVPHWSMTCALEHSAMTAHILQ